MWIRFTNITIEFVAQLGLLFQNGSHLDFKFKDMEKKIRNPNLPFAEMITLKESEAYLIASEYFLVCLYLKKMAKIFEILKFLTF